MKNILDENIEKAINERLEPIEKYFKGDVIFYYGPIYSSLEKLFRNFIEQLKENKKFEESRVVIFLNTPGGNVETVEKMVRIIRFHYKEVCFVVPDFAMSAGTIFCMSGDKIYMDYASSLGPIDPQVYNGKNWVPALGYLDKAKEFIKKSEENRLTQAEFLILKEMDLAELRGYEMARDLTINLLKEWLVKFKFKSWDKHSSTRKEVTEDEKKKRAEEIAKKLSDNGIWHSHGRSIGINTLDSSLKLKIEDYSNNKELRKLIRDYNDLICEYILRFKFEWFLHSIVSF